MASLIIAAPHFPPSAMPPSQRVRLLVRHLYKFGWTPTILTVDQYYREELADPWMMEITGSQFEQVTVGCLNQRISRKFGVGDMGIRIFFFLFKAIWKQTKKSKPDLVLYPVPPWYIMIMAPILKWMTGVPYIIDYIDPWIFEVKGKSRKAKISQWIARRFEGFVVKRSGAIIAVSQGILNDLVKRYPKIESIPMMAIPYGVEPTDFNAIPITKRQSETILIRYIGAISGAMLPVVDSLFKALKLLQQRITLQVEFIGTCYAGDGLVKPVLTKLIEENNLTSVVVEHPARVGYRKALELSMETDLQLLIGDTTPYYAASKLMGLVASSHPFFAIVHQGSFPATFLGELNYPGKYVFIASELDQPETAGKIAEILSSTIEGRQYFKPIGMDHPTMEKHTAYAMTKSFTDTFQKILHDKTALRKNQG